ncbi:MAG: AAA family ATPase [Lachnospiraceae bacterium]|nr:AAA family ATPase [Lachnospiraceae bacterium]
MCYTEIGPKEKIYVRKVLRGVCTDKVGIYLNPKKRAFQKALNSQIYVDKSELIAYTNQVLNSEQQYICVSRPRRFGKSMAANMLAAYYGRSADSREEFEHLKIGKEASFRKYLNRYNVIFLNMQEFLSDNPDIEAMKQSIEDSLLWELSAEYPDIHYSDRKNLIRTLYDIFDVENIPFIFIIDEWDCIFREKKEDKDAQSIYLNFLINLLKDKSYITLVYMTGILPVGNCLRDSEWDMIVLNGKFLYQMRKSELYS